MSDVKDHKVKFKDYGNSININDQEDQSIRDAMLLAIDKWGRTIRINGSPEFQLKAARIAFELGIEELQSDDQQALAIFRSLKEGIEPLDIVKQDISANFEQVLQ